MKSEYTKAQEKKLEKMETKYTCKCGCQETYKSKDSYGKMTTWCWKCGSRLSPDKNADRMMPGTVGHRLSLVTA